MTMTIYRAGSRPSTKGPDENFTGNVWIDMLFGPDEPARTSGALVNFEPGARTAWHLHPLGQYLIVTAGRGWTQCWGGPKKEISAGDVVHCECGQKHWHGATESTGMSHLAIQEWLDGAPVTWLEKVTDDQYRCEVQPD